MDLNNVQRNREGCSTDSREAIIEAATALIEQSGEGVDSIAVRDICGRAGVGLGLVNYHFGSKERLVEVCVERMVNGVVDRFRQMREDAAGLSPFEKIEYLGNMTLDFLFEHRAVSKISMLTDMRSPRADDNTGRTFAAYLPLVAACRPDLDEAGVRRTTFCLITVMQQAFLRQEAFFALTGVDLTQKEERRAWHRQILRDILGVQK